MTRKGKEESSTPTVVRQLQEAHIALLEGQLADPGINIIARKRIEGELEQAKAEIENS